MIPTTSVTTKLDPREARPLTSREISKVICGIIGGVVTYDQDARAVVPEVIKAVRANSPLREVNYLAQRSLPARRRGTSWACALSATVAGLRGWCDPKDVETALSWVAENLDRILPAATASIAGGN